MKLTRNYLTSDELAFIVNSMLEKDNALDREIVKIGLIAQVLCDDIGEVTTCNEIYDKIVSENIDFNNIINYYVIDNLVDKELGINNIIKKFVEDINKKLDEMGDIDLENIIKQLKEVSDKQNTESPMPIKESKRNGKKTKEPVE